VRADVKIVSADPFTYYKIASLPKDNKSIEQFWARAPRAFNVCSSKYQGITNLALTKIGCLKKISPSNPKETDILVVVDECMSSKDLFSPRDYTVARCRPMRADEFDAASVQMKMEGEQLLLYCPHQYYKVGNESLTACPQEVISITAKANVSV